MRLLSLAISLTACSHIHYICAGDSVPSYRSFKPGQTISFPPGCAYDWQGGTVKNGPILFAGGR
jgi:hypothetical protein